MSINCSHLLLCSTFISVTVRYLLISFQFRLPMHLGRISAYIFNLIHHEMVAHKKTKKKNSLL